LCQSALAMMKAALRLFKHAFDHSYLFFVSRDFKSRVKSAKMKLFAARTRQFSFRAALFSKK